MLEARADKKWGDDELYIKYKNETPVLFIKLQIVFLRKILKKFYYYRDDC